MMMMMGKSKYNMSSFIHIQWDFYAVVSESLVWTARLSSEKKYEGVNRMILSPSVSFSGCKFAQIGNAIIDERRSGFDVRRSVDEYVLAAAGRCRMCVDSQMLLHGRPGCRHINPFDAH